MDFLRVLVLTVLFSMIAYFARKNRTVTAEPKDGESEMEALLRVYNDTREKTLKQRKGLLIAGGVFVAYALVMTVASGKINSVMFIKVSQTIFSVGMIALIVAAFPCAVKMKVLASLSLTLKSKGVDLEELKKSKTYEEELIAKSKKKQKSKNKSKKK